MAAPAHFRGNVRRYPTVLIWWCTCLLVVSWVRTAAASPDWTDCPAACRCKWTSGKKSALCPNAGFTTLPSALNSDMQVLDLTGNAITYLTKDAFSSVGLLNLQRIFMKNTGVREIHRDAFRDLKILVEVDLSDNSVERVQTDTFSGNDRLRILYLNGNPLKELVAEQFPNLPHLRNLELENCQLTHIHRDAFVHLNLLESLNLKRNNLAQLSEAVFMPIARIKTLALDGNPWKCDCHLRGFRNWFLSSNLHSISLLCAEPDNLAGKQWEEVPSVQFACAPEVTITDKLVQEEVGGNATFGCHVRGDPEPEVTWLFNGHPLGSVNASHADQVLLIEVEDGLRDKWTNVSVYNLTEADAGEYSCVAKNSLGVVSKNITLNLPEVVTATTLSKADSWLLLVGLVGGGVATVISAVTAVTCTLCVCGRARRRKRHRRKGNIKGSVSFTDQEKKLLDVSITTTTERPSGAGSCEVLGSQADMELMEHSPSIPLELCDPQPVHITIESHSIPHPAEPITGTLMPVVSGYPATLGVFPPPPEFSTSVLPAGAFGNIFISVSVSQDPNLDVQRYPDLLDIPHRSKEPSVSVAAGPDTPFCPMAVTSYATLPRRPMRNIDSVFEQHSRMGPQYDNMGPRVTAGGSSTLSLPDADTILPVEEIPTPPPPPHCTPHTGEYVSL